MSAVHTAPVTEAPATTGRSTLMRWLGGGSAAVAVACAIAIAAWPASEADKARADGEAYGEAVADLYAAQTPGEVDAALADVHMAASDARVHAGDAVAEQVADQEDALARAVDGFVGVQTADDDFEADLYQVELDAAVDDLEDQAADFRTTGPETQQAFWDGYQTGLSGD